MVSISNVDTPAKGKRKSDRKLVATCTCGWSLTGVSLVAFGSVHMEDVFLHLRDHELMETPARFEAMGRAHVGWQPGVIVAGYVECAAGRGCSYYRDAPRAGIRALRHDPEDHYGEPRKSHQSCYRAPDGRLYHHECLPTGIRRSFTWYFNEEDEFSESAVCVLGTEAVSA